MKTLILATLIGLSLSIPISVEAAELMTNQSVAARYLELGRREYKEKRFDAAEVAYRRAALTNPMDPMPHYLLANLLASTDKHVDAIAEYKASLRLGPTSSVSKFCRQALAAYKQTTFAEDASPRSDEYIPPPPPSKLDTAIDVINKQAQFEKARHQQFASRLGKTAENAADWRAREIQRNAESDIANLYASRVVSSKSSRSRTDSSDLEAMAKRIQREADEKVKLEQALAKEKAAQHAEWAKERQMELDRTAFNLKDQLTDRPSDFGFDLDAGGTGLYVRNYKSYKPKKVLPDPRFSVLRLTEPGVQDGR